MLSGSVDRTFGTKNRIVYIRNAWVPAKSEHVTTLPRHGGALLASTHILRALVLRRQELRGFVEPRLLGSKRKLPTMDPEYEDILDWLDQQFGEDGGPELPPEVDAPEEMEHILHEPHEDLLGEVQRVPEPPEDRGRPPSPRVDRHPHGRNGAGNRASRAWVFTYFPDPEGTWYPDQDSIQTQRVKYLVCQPEWCPTTGALHWQGYVELHDPAKRPRVQEILGIGRAFCEPRAPDSTRDHARDYCIDPDKRARYADGTLMEPVEIGIFELGGQGRSSRLQEVILRGRQGASLRDALANNEEVLVRHSQGLPRVWNMFFPIQRDRTQPNIVVWLWGAPGAGKSRCAFDLAETLYPSRYYCKDPSTIWWDAYIDQPCAVLDDVAAHCSFRDLIRWIDRMPCTAQIKGSHVDLLAKFFILTSVERPENIMWTGHVQIAELTRRITHTIFIHAYEGDLRPIMNQLEIPYVPNRM